MDFNWYASEKIVEETLRARRARAELPRVAPVAPRYAVRRRITAVLIRVFNTIAHSRENRGERSRAATA